MDFVKSLGAFPVTEYAMRFAHDLAANVIRSGPVPKHMAFVMDGNRRFAKKYGLEAGEGHYAGFETFLRVAAACAQTGVHTITVYAFSIENFNRKKEESDLLFGMMRTKIWDMVKDQDSIARRNGWRIKVLGNRAMLADDILERIEKIESLTKDYDKMVVNICCPYTSRDDIAQALRTTTTNLVDGGHDDVTTHDFERALYLGESEPLDVLIRTSGETRLSDFMCWESSPSVQVTFIPTLWPEFTVWELYGIILRWAYRESHQGKQGIFRYDQLPEAPPALSVSDARNRN